MKFCYVMQEKQT